MTAEAGYPIGVMQHSATAAAPSPQANIGLTAFGPAWMGHAVVALEPGSVNLPYLRATLCLNDWSGRGVVTVVPAAVGAKSGSIQFFMQGERGDNSAVSKEAALRMGSEHLTNVTVPMVTIDDWLASHPQFDPALCALLKIDVQGYELMVLQGAARFLAVAGPGLEVRAEHDDELAGFATGDVQAVGRLLGELGFREVGRDGGDVLWRKVGG